MINKNVSKIQDWLLKTYSKDLPLEWMYRYAPQAKLVDGASEVHKMVIARNLLSDGKDFWSWD